ncbi:MAG: DUF748 domain-containing protein [Burkholderiales bacterium]|nr:DUF748 domain-containing protein [Burkholderiales bacterium]
MTARESPIRVKQRLARIVRSRLLLTGLGLLAVYAACGFFLLPYLVERYVPEFARETLKRQASVGKVRINPFLLTFEASDLRFAESDGSPIAGVRRLFLDFQASSLLRWAWTFKDIAVDGLDLHLVTGPGDRVNLAELAAAFREGAPAAPEKPEPPPRILLQHVVLSDARLTYTDRSGPAPASATVAPINVALEDVSTLPERMGPYAIRATLPGGGEVGWRGEVSLRPVASDGELTVTGFRPQSIWKFLQDEVRLAPPDGAIDFTTRYHFLFADGKPELQLSGARLRVAGLSLRLAGAEQPLVALQRVEASDIGFDLLKRELKVPKLALSDGEIAANVAEDGTIDWQTIAVGGEQAAAVPSPERPASANPWRVALPDIAVADVGFRATDQSRATPLALDVGKVKIDAAAELELGGTASTVVSNALRVELSGIALTRLAGGEPLATVESVALQGRSIDTAKREIVLGELAVRGGGTKLTRDAQGGIDLVEVASTRGKLRRSVAEAGAATKAEGAPWRFRLDALDLREFRISLADRSVEPAIGYDLTDVSATLKNLSSDPRAPVAFDVALAVAQGGRFSGAGSFTADGSSAEARVKLAALNLAPLQPAVARVAALELKSGNLSASATLQYRAAKSGPRLQAKGALGVAGLRVNEADTGDRFLAWKTLSVNGASFELAPDRLAIAEVRLVEPEAKIVVFKDRSVNLATVVKARAGATEAGAGAAGKGAGSTEASVGATEAGAGATEAVAAPAETFPVTVERVRVQGGTVDFADLSLVLPFAARITDLAGSATGISSDPASRAEMAFEGEVAPSGLARVSGAIRPFAPKQFTDLRAEFRNVAMTPLSPYTATFAGRTIASGSLTLDLGYKIENGQLLGDNKVLLDKFTLGERVEAPGALQLPLDLAIALLTDANGRIDVAVPVRGDVDHPEFSYGHLVWQAIVTVIKNIVTAPFRALGALLGGDAEKLDAVAFDPGADRVLPPELEKLKQVAGALQKRPQLKLIVEGRYDAALDGEALRADKVRRELAAAEGVKLEPGEAPGPVAFDAAKTQVALEKLMGARAGERAMAEFQAGFEQRVGRKAARVNRALALIGKGSADREFYEALYARLVALHPLDAAELEALAKRRATAVAEALVKTAGVEPARVAIGKPEATSEAARDTVGTRLRLDVLKGAS